MAVKTRMTLDEYLALPETEPASEFVCGEVIQKPMPTYVHSLLQFRLATLITEFLKRTGRRGVALPEVRHAARAEQRAFLPDIAVFLDEKARPGREVAMRGPIEYLPDLAIEILSPDDRPGRMADKLAFYLRIGVPLVWIVDPELRTVDAHRPGEPSVTHHSPEELDAVPVLPELRLDLGDFFSILDELED